MQDIQQSILGLPSGTQVLLESYRLEFYENFNYLIFIGNTFFPQKIESLRLDFHFVQLESLRLEIQVAILSTSTSTKRA